MTDQQAASSVNFIRSSASSLTPAGNELDALGINPGQSGAFSKELSRASQRTESVSEPSRSRQNPPRESVHRTGNQTSESSGRTDSAEASRRIGDRTDSPVDDARKPQDSTESTGSTDSVDRRNDENGRRAERETTTESQSGVDVDNGSTVSAEMSGSRSESSTASRAGLSAVQAEGLDTIEELAVVEENVVSVVNAEDENGSTSADGPLPTGIPAPVQNEDSLSGQESDKLVHGVPASASYSEPGKGVPPTAYSLTSANLETGNDVINNVGRTSAHRLSTGEHLSPAELANRQGVILSNSGTRDRQSAGALMAGIGSEQAEIDVPLSRAAGVVNTPGTATALQSSLMAVDQTPVERQLGLQGLPPVEKEGMQDTRQMVQSDMQLQANAKKELLAQRVEQENTAASFLQSKQLAQQQVQSAVLASASADNVSQTPDNMFHSLSGGIVTAPILQRADAGNTQAVNAPVNMPILQNDADKAMASNIRWMVNEGVKNAVINVTPSGMGPISVSIGLEKEQMNVSIVALQGATREALDSMLPRLREQLAAQGHDSVKVDISDGRPEQSDRGYSEQFLSERNDAESGTDSEGTHSNVVGIGEDASDKEQSAGMSEQGSSTLQNMGQLKSSYDVYV